LQPRVLARDTYEFNNAYVNTCRSSIYKYEVELIALTDLRGSHSIINTNEFQQFIEKEYDKEKISGISEVYIISSNKSYNIF